MITGIREASIFLMLVKRHSVILSGILEKQGWTHGMDSDSRDGLDLNHGQLR